ncbi:MAG: cation diffusion facilitator family transporter [Tissierellia bacterium]|nr:cation diffusion facilitator family transporter [Tissierellia bacterium]
MFTLLSKKFIKNYKNYKDNEVRSKLISLSGVVSTIINVLLFVIKITIGIMTNSVSVISDAFNNMSDILTSLISIIGSTISRIPADDDHPLGHGRSEYIASFLVSLIIMFVGVELFKNSILSFFRGSKLSVSNIAIAILFLSILFKLYTYFLNNKLKDKLDSKLNEAMAIDSRNDMISSFAIVISLIIQKNTGVNVDGIMGIIVSIFVFKPGLSICKETIDSLLGKRVPDDTEERIKEIILNSKLVIGCHDLRIHDYGKGNLMGSCHVDVPSNLDISTIHKEVTFIENKILEDTGVDITFHMDPSYCISNKELIEFYKEDRENIDEYENKDLQNRPREYRS